MKDEVRAKVNLGCGRRSRVSLDPMRCLLVFIVVSWSTIAIVRGSVGGSELEVLRWEKTGPREMELEVIETRDHMRKIIHIRYGPDRVAHFRSEKHLQPAAKADHDRAFELLCQQLRASNKVRVLLTGEDGYRPIRNRKGHFRTELLQLIPPGRYGNSEEIVCFVPPDLDSDSTD
jgi:hypothetical protein